MSFDKPMDRFPEMPITDVYYTRIRVIVESPKHPQSLTTAMMLDHRMEEAFTRAREAERALRNANAAERQMYGQLFDQARASAEEVRRMIADKISWSIAQALMEPIDRG